MKPIFKKIFKKGEYYQTYFLKLELMFDENKSMWIYKTFIRKHEKEKWQYYKCDYDKIKIHIISFINEYTSYIKSCDIIEDEEKN